MLSSAQKISLGISLGVHGLVAAVVLAWPGVHSAARNQRIEMPVLHLISLPEDMKMTAAISPPNAPLVTPAAAPPVPAQPPVDKPVEVKSEPMVVATIEPKPDLVSTLPATIVEAKASDRPLALAPGPSTSSNPAASIEGSAGGVSGTNQVSSTGVARKGVFKAARVRAGAAPEPIYPVTARKRRMEGIVLLLVTVGENGDPSRVNVRETSGSSLLDTAAIDAVRLWKFEPAEMDRRAVSSELEVPVRFQLTR